MIDEEATLLVDDEFPPVSAPPTPLSSRRSLAACRDRIEDPAGGADRQHSPDPCLSCRNVDRVLDEMSSEGGLLMGFGEVAEFVNPQRRALIARSLRERHSAGRRPDFARLRRQGRRAV